MTKLDLSKYEDHSSGPWGTSFYDGWHADRLFSIVSGDKHVIRIEYFDYDLASLEIGSKPDMALILDAPLILAYAKQLEARVRELEAEVSFLKDLVL